MVQNQANPISKTNCFIYEKGKKSDNNITADHPFGHTAVSTGCPLYVTQFKLLI